MKKVLLTLSLISVVALSFAANNDKVANKDKSSVATSSSTASSVSISGRVIDLNSGEALAGVEVAIEGQSKNAHTDLDGNFKIDNLKPGEYNVIASYISYNKSFIEKLEVVKSNQSLDIKLQSAN